MIDPKSNPQVGMMDQIRHYILVLFKWKWTAALFFILVALGATLYAFLKTPVYTAQGSLWIEDKSRILPFEEIDTLGAGSTLQSHARLLRSRSLLAEVAEKLNLFENPAFAAVRTGEKAVPDSSSPMIRERVIESILKSLSVSPVPGTRLVDVAFAYPDPRIAADILNALFEGYIDLIVKKRFQVSQQATESLNSQIESLRNEIAEREAALSAYGSEKDILPLTAAEAPTVSRLAEINKALTDATLERINKLNYYNQIKDIPLGDFPGAPAGSLIQNLRQQYLSLSRDYAKRLVDVRPELPEMRRLKSELDAAEEALRTESQNFVRAAYTDYEAALNLEQSYRRLLNTQKNEAYKSNSNSIVYNNLRIELESRKSLMETLSKRQGETVVSSRLTDQDTINVWVADKAEPPLDPTSPNKRKILLFGLLIGLAGGAGLALVLETMNQTVKTTKDIALSTGLPTLGTVPTFESDTKSKGPASEIKRILQIIEGSGAGRERKHPSGKELNENIIELVALRKPQSIQAESYRSVRTTLLVSFPKDKLKSILITSALAREGKSSTTSNLGVTLAQALKRVVIVDSDLRKPKQGRIFGMKEGLGLSEFLSSPVALSDLVRPTHVPNLFLITSGPLPANPIEILTSPKMSGLIESLVRAFDYVLFDTPPILAVSDALVLGPMADGILLVARGGLTPVSALRQAKQKLDAHNLSSFGVILNSVNLVEQDGYYAREYYQYSKAE